MSDAPFSPSVSADDVATVRHAINSAMIGEAGQKLALAALARLAQERDEAREEFAEYRDEVGEQTRLRVAAEQALAQTREALDAADSGLREIVRAGTRFDAKGTHSRWVVERAQQALSRPPTVQEPR